jgi:ribonucleoside-triphosphate reductase
MVKMVIKRDGTKVPFENSRIVEAVKKAGAAVSTNIDDKFINLIVEEIIRDSSEEVELEFIQDTVEKNLLDSAEYRHVGKIYIIYRKERAVRRSKDSKSFKTYNEIINIEENNIKNENANMNGNTPAGQMMKFASETTKSHTDDYLLNPIYVDAHAKGLIHIHDKDYYPTKTTTCVQYDLDKLFDGGFDTGHGMLRQPKSIRSYAALAAIAFQTNQNEQHGGQSIPAFDHFMVPGVKASFVRHFEKHLKRTNPSITIKSIEMSLVNIDNKDLQERFSKAYEYALEDTQEECDQAMEAFIANMNSMHSRGGNQVVFSSVNYGTDFSTEARMVMFSLLKATEKGLGDGETPIFPIQIFKVKEGISFNEEDFELAINNIDDATSGKLKFKAPNFDLFVRSCVVSAKRLFPNFSFLDSTFNKHDGWDINDPDRYRYEMAYMGCRTRVFDNRFDERSAWGRGNISFTSINLVQIAIQSRITAENYFLADVEKHSSARIEKDVQAMATSLFMNELKLTCDLVAAQLYDRYKFQCTAKAKQFPFLMGQGVWMDGEKLKPNDRVEDQIKHGTLSMGYIGLAEALKMLTGKHHGESAESQELGLKIVGSIRALNNIYSERYDLNYSCLATPAEGLSGRFTAIDRNKYGEIAGVTDREYYTNSNHVPVYYPITAVEKIRIEAPYHELTNAGHILYVEMDAEAKKNIVAFMKIIREMNNSNAGYSSINHPIDRCVKCGYDGAIEKSCPICGETEQIDRIRRITGYLVGTTDRWNSFKKAEEKDRVKHMK